MPATIRAASASELAELARFVTRLQERPESAIPSLGRTAAEIAAQVEGWGADWFARCTVAELDGEVAGFIGADVDTEIERAWVHGPLVTPSHWDELAERLLERSIATAAASGVHDLELLGDVANARLAELAGAHDFERRTPAYSLEIRREHILALPPTSVPPFGDDHREALFELHETLFPGTYYSGAQLADQHRRGEATLLALVENGELVGYAAGRVDPAGGDGYLDFVGVAEAARGRGHGRTLVVAICRQLVVDPRCAKVALTVYEDNVSALALYDRLGFTRAASMVGYRRTSAPASGR